MPAPPGPTPADADRPTEDVDEIPIGSPLTRDELDRLKRDATRHRDSSDAPDGKGPASPSQG